MGEKTVIRTLLFVGFGLVGPAFAGHDYIADIDVVPGDGLPVDVARGTVFHDLSRDGVRQQGEPGLPGVLVSNGKEVVRSAADGSWTLPVRPDMTIMITKPAGYAAPTNRAGVPQYFYHHKPAGTPGEFRFGGLPPTGPLPARINFPLVEVGESERFSCVVMGDTQPYSNDEVGYIRDGVLETILSRDLAGAKCMILLGDVMGDDLGLLPRFMDVMSTVGLPQYYIHGNHDYDFDATSDHDSADSWRALYGPAYYSFEIGQVLFVALDNVVYPCTKEDFAPGDRETCGDPERPTYNGRVTETQLAWLDNLLAHLPEDRLVVLMHHIPFVSFVGSDTGRHQTDNLGQIHALVGKRPALSLSGHTHTFEFLAAGESFKPWGERVGVTRLPFDHIVAGAPSGNWFVGDPGFEGVPLSFGRDGTPPGFMILEFDGPNWRMTFHAANQPADRQMALSFSTPRFRAWFEKLMSWMERREDTAEAELPPLTVNDLGDLKLFTREELREGVWLTANVWAGERNSRVTAEFDGVSYEMERTQPGDGEDVLAGAEWADPFSVPRQMTIGRFAWRSESGNPRAQGFETWQGVPFGPASPRSVEAWMVADSSSHLWRFRLPATLANGAHKVTVTAIDRWGRTWTDHVVFEVWDERPPRYWRRELWPAD